MDLLTFEVLLFLPYPPLQLTLTNSEEPVKIKKQLARYTSNKVQAQIQDKWWPISETMNANLPQEMFLILTP